MPLFYIVSHYDFKLSYFIGILGRSEIKSYRDTTSQALNDKTCWRLETGAEVHFPTEQPSTDSQRSIGKA